MGLRLGVDVGGTFTDIIVLEEETGRVNTIKVPSTPQSPEKGVLDGLQRAGIAGGDISMLLHGTTITVNTILQGKMPKTSLITTAGFGDILEIARINRPDMYNLLYHKPEPLVPRNLVFEVRERMTNTGEIRTPLDEDSVMRAIQGSKDADVRAVGVCLLHSYASPVHEKRIGDLLAKHMPETYVSLSHELTRHYYEYERANTTILNAGMGPLFYQYLENLHKALSEMGYEKQLLISRSDGGVMTADAAKDRGVFTVQSGPASGVIGTLELSRHAGLENVISIDVGGTSFDASVISDGRPTIDSVSDIEGYQFIAPNIQISNIGAGGGSIAWIDSGGALQVGPMSAGADPGPICYGLGGQEPTVTDCAVLAGYIDPTYFLGGQIELDPSSALNGLRSQIADPLGMDVEEAAAGVIAVLERKMALKLREITIEKGLDPRDFTLVAFGGAGPMFGSALASILGCRKVLVPRAPGLFSAWGMLMLDVVHDISQTFVTFLERVKPSVLRVMIEKMKTEGIQFIRDQLGSKAEVQLDLSFDMRYSGQEHSVNVRLSPDFSGEEDKDKVESDFHSLHDITYGYTLSDPVEIVNIRLRAMGQVEKPRLPLILEGSKEPPRGAYKGARKVFSPGLGQELSFKVYERESLLAGNLVEGPAIVEELSSTTIVPDGGNLMVDQFGNLIIETKPEVAQ
ncbi:MAG: hydantoinase/oxoprolinase family protein [Thermoplasmata archaeon]